MNYNNNNLLTVFTRSVAGLNQDGSKSEEHYGKWRFYCHSNGFGDRQVEAAKAYLPAEVVEEYERKNKAEWIARNRQQPAPVELHETERTQRQTDSIIGNIPEALCFPPGVVGDIAKYVLARSSHKNSEFALSVGLAVVATVTGRKVVDESGTCPNIYLLNLGPTGCGKETPRKVLKQIMASSGLLGSERFTSDSAFVNSLMETPSMLSIADEIGDMIAELNDHRASSCVKNLATAMTDAFTQAGSPVWNYKGFADNAKTKTVYSPNFVLHGSGNAAKLFKSLSPEAISSGFVGRFVMFLSENGGGRPDNIATLAIDPQNPGPTEYSTTLEVPATVREYVSRWGEYKCSEDPITPLTIRQTEAARKRLQTHFADIHKRLSQDRGTAREEIWGRAAEKTAKFALFAALSRSGDTIDIEDANWAIALCNALTRRMVLLCSRHIAESAWDAKALQIMRRIQDSDKPVERSAVLKMSRVDARQFQLFIDWLIETGEIVTVQRTTKGRKGIGYAASFATIDPESGWERV